MSDDFLRRHPEIEKTFTDVYSTENGLRMNEHHARLAALAAVLPAILRAHEADLAGVGNAKKLLADVLLQGWLAQVCDAASCEARALSTINAALAAAYLAGYARARKEDMRCIEDVRRNVAKPFEWIINDILEKIGSFKP